MLVEWEPVANVVIDIVESDGFLGVGVDGQHDELLVAEARLVAPHYLDLAVDILLR